MNVESIDARVTILVSLSIFKLGGGQMLYRHMLIFQCKTESHIANHWEVKLSCLASRRCGVSVPESNASQGIF